MIPWKFIFNLVFTHFAMSNNYIIFLYYVEIKNILMGHLQNTVIFVVVNAVSVLILSAVLEAVHL